MAVKQSCSSTPQNCSIYRRRGASSVPSTRLPPVFGGAVPGPPPPGPPMIGKGPLGSTPMGSLQLICMFLFDRRDFSAPLILVCCSKQGIFNLFTALAALGRSQWCVTWSSPLGARSFAWEHAQSAPAGPPSARCQARSLCATSLHSGSRGQTQVPEPNRPKRPRLENDAMGTVSLVSEISSSAHVSHDSDPSPCTPECGKSIKHSS